MAAIKLGFKTFIQTSHPIAHPRRPFDIRRDLTPGTPGLFVYLTSTGKLAKRTKTYPTPVSFRCYTADRREAVVVGARRDSLPLTLYVPLDQLHRRETV